MILSMTGFGRGTAVRNGREITVELRSVNSRYFEYSSRMPRTCSYLDSRLKKQLNERVTRGKVELSLTVQTVDAADTVVAVNQELAKSYQQALRDLSETLEVKNDVTAGMIARFPDVLTTRHADVDEEQLWEDVSAVTAQALDRFVEMRAAEGAKMKADVENRLRFLEECVGRVETLSAGRVENYTNRLYEKLKVILEDRNIDDARVLTEAAIFGDKTAVDEETVRLRSHIAQYRSILEQNEPVGRKLDFLTQELNRESNTIGSKCSDVAIAQVVVDLKEFGIVQRALLGIRFAIVDQDFIDREGKELGITELGGAYVAGVVEGGSASEAGIRKGDVILDIDGVKINDNATLSEQIGRRRPHDKVKLSVKRDGAVKQFEVTLRNKAGKTELMTKEDVDVVEVLGGKFADAGTKLCRELDIRGGVQVVGIKADGILARARVKQGFVITHINDRPVYSVADMQRMDEKVRSIDGIYPNGRAASYTFVE